MGDFLTMAPDEIAAEVVGNAGVADPDLDKDLDQNVVPDEVAAEVGGNAGEADPDLDKDLDQDVGPDEVAAEVGGNRVEADPDLDKDLDQDIVISDITGEILLSVARGPVSTVLELQEEIERRLSLPMELQRLFAGQRVLEHRDDVTRLASAVLVEVAAPPLERMCIKDMRSSETWIDIGILHARGAQHGFRVSCHWKDQQWGYQKGRVRVSLLRKGGEVASEDCFGVCQRRGLYKVSKDFTPDASRVAAEAQGEDRFRFQYRTGGGGGHTLEICDFKAGFLDAPQ